MYTIELDNKLKIIRYKHSGIINAEDIGAAWTEFLQLKEFTSQKYNLLSDYRGGKFDMPVEMIKDITAYMVNIKHIVKGKKQAIISDDPYSLAASILFSEETYAKVGFIVKVFSTEKSALLWLTS